MVLGIHVYLFEVIYCFTKMKLQFFMLFKGEIYICLYCWLKSTQLSTILYLELTKGKAENSKFKLILILQGLSFCEAIYGWKVNLTPAVGHSMKWYWEPWNFSKVELRLELQTDIFLTWCRHCDHFVFFFLMASSKFYLSWLLNCLFSKGK